MPDGLEVSSPLQPQITANLIVEDKRFLDGWGTAPSLPRILYKDEHPRNILKMKISWGIPLPNFKICVR